MSSDYSIGSSPGHCQDSMGYLRRGHSPRRPRAMRRDRRDTQKWDIGSNFGGAGAENLRQQTRHRATVAGDSQADGEGERL